MKRQHQKHASVAPKHLTADEKQPPYAKVPGLVENGSVYAPRYTRLDRYTRTGTGFA